MSVKLKASLPKDEESNGLDDGVRDELLADPRKPRVGVVVFAVEETTKSLATGQETPKLRIERIELITDAEEADLLVRRVQALSEVRTGNTPLPQTKGKAEAALDFDDEGDDVDYDAMHADDFDGPEAA